MDIKRIQLTLFVEKNQSKVIEQIRKEYNPKQFDLINSHVTLCREDEIGEVDKVLEILSSLNHKCIIVNFDKAIRFSNGNGILMPSAGTNEQFQELRKSILQGLERTFRKHEPHITLMHPRNSTCTDRIFEQVSQIRLPHQVDFKKISLIEQEGGSKWNIIKELRLKEIIDP